MNISKAGIELIKKFEGCRLTAYKCAAGVLTIGYGHTSGVYSGQTITQQQADEYLKEDLKKFEDKVNKYNSYNWSQNEFDALVSFAFNIGNIDQLTAKGTRDKETIANKMLEYINKGSSFETGLRNRRKAERELFLKESGNSNNNNAAAAGVKTMELKLLKAGSKGVEVAAAQGILTYCKYSLGKIDGIYGKKTAGAVKQFQANKGLKADGIIGSKTWAELMKVA